MFVLIWACVVWVALLGNICGWAGYYLGARLICRDKPSAKTVSQLLAGLLVAVSAGVPYLFWDSCGIQIIELTLLNLCCAFPAAIIAFVVASRAVSPRA